MSTKAELAIGALRSGGQTLDLSLRGMTLDEALDPAGGFRSILGVLKHTAGWSHVYHSYAFEASPLHFQQTSWPRGLRDVVVLTQDYVDEIIAWQREGQQKWIASVNGLADDEFDAQRPCHWGTTLPLFEIVQLVFNHWCYHAGEINALLSIRRGHAWEYTEEVEENYISTAGHRLRPEWMSAEHAAKYEAYLAKRDRELHGSAPSQ